MIRTPRPAALLTALLLAACAGDDAASGSDTASGTSTGTTAASTTGTQTSDDGTSTGDASTTDATTTDATTTDATTTTGDETTTGETTGSLPPPPRSIDDVLDGEVELISEGHMFTEGPVWDVDGGALLFSDIPANTIHRWAMGEGTSVFRMPSDNSNGLIFDNEGRLLACEHGARRLSRTEGDQVVTVVDSFEGSKLNSPNDLVVRSDGSVFFTDPPYGIQPDQQELDFQGVFLVDPQGALSLLVDDFGRPNGLVLSPDENTLYIADTQARHIRSFSVGAGGELADDTVFVDMNTPDEGNPDGMAIDAAGDLLTTGPGGIWVVTREGDHLGTIAVPEVPSNCTFGGADGKTLFITARTSVYAVRLKIAGLGWP
ncbi:MAG: SMP-30/gluconolactonase/LRE family protein [Nannocystaceae bacterium]